MSASDSAKSRMERVLRLHEQVDALKLDIRQVYAEEKADGGDKTAMGAAVSYIRKRDKEGSDLADREAMADVYLAAYDAPRAHTHTRESQSYTEAKGRGDLGATEGHSLEMAAALEPSNFKASSVQKIETAAASLEDETGEITDNQDQIGGNGTDLPVEASTEKQAAGASRPTNSNSPDDLPAEANNAGEVIPSQAQASPAANSDDDVPAFIKRDKPDCLKLKDGHCRLSFATSALCAECNQHRVMARALA